MSIWSLDDINLPTVTKNSLEIDNLGNGGHSDDHLLQYLFQNAKEMGLIKIEDEKVYKHI